MSGRDTGRGYRQVGPAADWVAMEERVMARWRERDIFRRSVEARRGAPPYVFYEGPPTANGRPGSHHVLARAFKDIFPRFQSMRGRFVDRRGGWDCHGLPVEIEVEKELGIAGKPGIEAYGIAEFNARCRASVMTYVEEWERLTERIGMWVDTDRAYRTMDATYVESVWWSLATLFERGLLFEADKVVPYCSRCGTALSSHELALGYKDIDDPSVYVRFPLVGEPGTSLLVWTTTPWTLPSNQAAVVNPDVGYAAAEVDGERLILAEALVERVLGEGTRVAERIPASALVGRAYEPPFPYIPGAHRVLTADYVTTDDGTGIVHIAPAFGADDLEVGRANGLDAPNPVDRQGRFTERVPLGAGRFVKDADADLVADLAARGRLFRAETYTHSYPHCWRCSTPLIYYAKPSWYIRTTAVRDRLLAENAQIGWHPEHVRDGRFGKWLEGNVDWALSRERYWGTPLPLWRCDSCERVEAIGSFAALAERSGVAIGADFDPHRPYVDDIGFACECGGEMRRVPDVIDVWYDSGAMPFAQDHHPFSRDVVADGGYPADFICEALDQTRGWFYSLIAEGVLLFDRSSYRNVVCLGLMLDADGQKMSKTKGNVIEPWSVLESHGADAFRWYLFTGQSPWDSFRFGTDALDEALRFLFTLWNTYAFFVTYASLPDGWQPADGAPPEAERPAIDRWLLGRLAEVTAVVTERLEGYDATTSGRAIGDLVDDMSNWYVRTCRRRFYRSGAADDARAAFATLHEALVTVSMLIAPFCPFVADEIYANLVATQDPDAPESVHMADWPASTATDASLASAMAATRAAVELGRAARTESKIKVRQPLAEAVIACPPAVAEMAAGLEDLIRGELNVRAVRFVTDPSDLVSVALKPNYRTLGPRFGNRMPSIAKAIAGLDAAEALREIDSGRSIFIAIDEATIVEGRETRYELGSDDSVKSEITGDDLLREVRPSEGYVVASDGPIAVGLATGISADLRLEGLAREVVHAVQNARKQAGLEVQDRIRLHLDGSGLIREAIDAHRPHIAAETLASELSVSHGAPFAGIHHEEHVLDGEPLAIRLDRA